MSTTRRLEESVLEIVSAFFPVKAPLDRSEVHTEMVLRLASEARSFLGP